MKNFKCSYICVYVCVYVCVFVCICICVSMILYPSIYLSMYYFIYMGGRTFLSGAERNLFYAGLHGAAAGNAVSR